ncbi:MULTISPECIES: AAA family ATPase [unclassified Pseudomonas]|uniref:AAA family ATPase n=1 Tax=unclassified Pseudomonas TaxID=196821 RepID=UPI001B32C348|nr:MULTISPECIES: AAA family ATPase [unclassified Pseudomonas]
MTVKIKPSELKALRKSKNLTINCAAKSINRDPRTWSEYESEKRSFSNIPIDNFSSFLRAHKIFWPFAKVISISAYKGGIGKSPITIAVAAVFAAKGFKVAIVTNDEIYRGYSKQEVKEAKFSGRSTGLVDFYDELDVIMYAGEMSTLKHTLEKSLREPHGTVFPGDLEKLARKQAAGVEFDALKKSYDVIFLDINRDLAQTIIKSDLVALLVDAACPFAYSSTKRYCESMRKLNDGVMDSIYMLLTNLSPVPRLRGGVETETNSISELYESLVWRSEFGASNYKKLRELGVPYLKSRFSSDHEYYIERHDDSQILDQQFCYFDTVMDIAPDSLAAVEVCEVANELEQLLWAKGLHS